jgi:hypothetical protein
MPTTKRLHSGFDARAMQANLLHYCDGACRRHHSANRSNEKFGTLSHWRRRLDKLTNALGITVPPSLLAPADDVSSSLPRCRLLALSRRQCMSTLMSASGGKADISASTRVCDALWLDGPEMSAINPKRALFAFPEVLDFARTTPWEQT